jgi:hypothetical protein
MEVDLLPEANSQDTMVDASNIIISLQSDRQFDEDNQQCHLIAEEDNYSEQEEEPTHEDNESNGFSHHVCINPMTPIQKYIYRINVYNSQQTLHYKTAYVVYNKETRIYTLYAIVSNVYYNEQENTTTTTTTTTPPVGDSRLPTPKNTIQMKYKSYVRELILNYIMTVIVPSVEYDYYIKDDMLGVIGSQRDVDDTYDSDDTSFYDIDNLMNECTTRETINGYNAFMLIPTRNFWYIPITTDDFGANSQHRYTMNAADSILTIL